MLNMIDQVKSFVTNNTIFQSKKHSFVSHRSRYFQGEGIVDEAIHPHRKGRVRFRGSWWFAKCEDNLTIAPGEMVEVLGVQDITLIVKPYSVE